MIRVGWKIKKKAEWSKKKKKNTSTYNFEVISLSAAVTTPSFPRIAIIVPPLSTAFWAYSTEKSIEKVKQKSHIFSVYSIFQL